MLFTILKPRITPRQKTIALTVAAGADLLQIVFWPLFGEGFLSPFEDLLDLIVAGVLIAICGFRWQFVLAFFLEAVPGFDLFPTWTALVLSLPVTPADVPRFNVLPATSPVTRRHHAHSPINVAAVAVPPVQPEAQQCPR
jgi:hypothetical protein